MADSSLSYGNSESSSFNPPSRAICLVCQKQFSQYTCPRCNTRYCSLTCYKSHSKRCTESFMRDNVLQEMQTIRTEDAMKRRTLEMLKRMYSEEEENDMDEDDFIVSEETAEKVLSGGNISFEELTAEEKKEFLRVVATGELSKMIEPWDPWWLKPSAKAITLSKEGTRLIQPLHENPDSFPNDARDIPPGPATPLPPVGMLISTEPSPFLIIHLVDILYSYCFTLRIYNGDWQSDASGAAIVVLSISSVLGQAGLPETVMEALSYCLEQVCSPDFKQMGGLDLGLKVVDDVVSLLYLGIPALVCALCDLRTMMESGDRDLKAEKSKSSKTSVARNKLKLAGRKIYFLTCWLNDQPSESLSSLAAAVETEKRSFVCDRGSKPAVSKLQTKKKAVIEEVL